MGGSAVLGVLQWPHGYRDAALRIRRDVNVTNKDGCRLCTPIAILSSRLPIARELTWSLCDLKIRGKEGKTAAEKAKEEKHALAEYLANHAPREQVRCVVRLRCRTHSRRVYFPLGSEHLSSETDVVVPVVSTSPYTD